VWRDGHEIQLTRTEFDLLELLVFNTESVLTRDIILERIWGFDFTTTSNSLDVYIGYLRRKTEKEEGSASSTRSAASVSWPGSDEPPLALGAVDRQRCRIVAVLATTVHRTLTTIRRTARPGRSRIW
jgi:hypothetical protein